MQTYLIRKEQITTACVRCPHVAWEQRCWEQCRAGHRFWVTGTQPPCKGWGGTTHMDLPHCLREVRQSPIKEGSSRFLKS